MQHLLHTSARITRSGALMPSATDFQKVHDLKPGEYIGKLGPKPHWFKRLFFMRAKRSWFGVIEVKHTEKETTLCWTSHGAIHDRSYGKTVIAGFRGGKHADTYIQVINMWPVNDKAEALAIAERLYARVLDSEFIGVAQ